MRKILLVTVTALMLGTGASAQSLNEQMRQYHEQVQEYNEQFVLLADVILIRSAEIWDAAHRPAELAVGNDGLCSFWLSGATDRAQRIRSATNREALEFFVSLAAYGPMYGATSASFEESVRLRKQVRLVDEYCAA